MYIFKEKRINFSSSKLDSWLTGRFVCDFLGSVDILPLQTLHCLSQLLKSVTITHHNLLRYLTGKVYLAGSFHYIITLSLCLTNFSSWKETFFFPYLAKYLRKHKPYWAAKRNVDVKLCTLYCSTVLIKKSVGMKHKQMV